MNEELRVIISAEVSKLQSAVKNAKKSIADFTKDAREKVEKFGEDFSAVGDKAKAGLAIVGGAVAGAGAALIGLTASTEEYRTAQAKLNTAFETAGASAGTAKQTYNDLYRVLGDGDVAVEAAGHLAKLTTEEKALNEWTTICQGVYATFGDSIPIEGLTEAANETAKVGTLTGSLADALNWAGVNEEAFQAQLDACNTEAEREALIRETLNGLYTDAATSYEKNNAAMLAQNEAQAKLSEATARVGEALQPVMTALTTLGADILTALAPYIEQFAAQYLPKVTEALAGVGEKIGVVIGWISDNWELVSTIGTIVLSIVGTLAALSGAITVVSTVLTIATSPISLVVLGIAALVAAIVLCIKYWDEIKAAVEKAAKAIWEKVQEMANKVGEWFSNMREKIASTKLGEFVLSIFDSIANNIKTKIELAKTIVTNVVSAIKGIFTGDFTAVKTSLLNILTAIVINFKTKFESAKQTVFGIFDKIKSGLSDKINAAKDAVGSVIETIKGFFDFDFKMPHIPKPSFSISPSGWKVGDLLHGSIPKLSISWNAQGGLFDKPTVFGYGGSLQGIGENGAEALIPLERNTRALDLIAGKMVERMGLNTPIVLSVEGKVLAQTTISSINQLTRQTGRLGLNIV